MVVGSLNQILSELVPDFAYECCDYLQNAPGNKQQALFVCALHIYLCYLNLLALIYKYQLRLCAHFSVELRGTANIFSLYCQQECGLLCETRSRFPSPEAEKRRLLGYIYDFPGSTSRFRHIFVWK